MKKLMTWVMLLCLLLSFSAAEEPAAQVFSGMDNDERLTCTVQGSVFTSLWTEPTPVMEGTYTLQADGTYLAAIAANNGSNANLRVITLAARPDGFYDVLSETAAPNAENSYEADLTDTVLTLSEDGRFAAYDYVECEITYYEEGARQIIRIEEYGEYSIFWFDGSAVCYFQALYGNYTMRAQGDVQALDITLYLEGEAIPVTGTLSETTLTLTDGYDPLVMERQDDNSFCAMVSDDEVVVSLWDDGTVELLMGMGAGYTGTGSVACVPGESLSVMLNDNQLFSYAVLENSLRISEELTLPAAQ